MDNKTVSELFNEIYNNFWMKHRDNLPDLYDGAGWDVLIEEGKALMRKYDCQLARDMVAGLLGIMDQRQRTKESGDDGR